MTARHARRGLLAGCGAMLAGAAVRRPAGAAVVPRLVVAGEPGGRLDRWATSLAVALQRHWAGAAGLATQTLGGDDGVTGTNDFMARGPADGTALLLPGAAASAWLAGDPRVQFDAARWLPVLCRVSGGLVAGRRSLADARRQLPLRLALTDPLGPAAASLLGLDLLQVPARPVAEADPVTALRAGLADTVFLPGDDAEQVAGAAGARPLFTLGSPAPSAAVDPADEAAVPTLPSLLARGASPDRALLAAWQAIATAAQLDCALVLPPLTDAADVALWREAAERAAADPTLAVAADPQLRLVAMPGCAAVLRAVAVDSAGLLACRRWLAIRLAYQPG